MKKLLFLLFAFVTVTMQAQTANGSETQFEGIQLIYPQTVTSVNYLSTMGNTGVVGRIDPVLLPLTTATINAINTATSGKANLSGGNSFTGNQNFASNSKLKVGSNTSYGKISVADNTTSMDSHSLDFYDVITSSVTGQGYGVVDVSSVITGSTDNDHFLAYQARPFYTGTGAISGQFGFGGFFYQPTHSGTGVVQYARGVRLMGVLGTGPILNDIGLEIDDRARGSLSNVAIKTGFGKVIFGDEMTVAGNSSFAKQLLVNGSTASDAQLAVTNASATGYGMYLKGGNSSNFALRVDDYLGAVILEATLGKLAVNGTVTASPATLSNELITKAQLDATAPTSGTYTPTVTNGANSSGASLLKASYIKVGNIVTVRFAVTSTPTLIAPNSVNVNITLPFNRTNSTTSDFGSGSSFDSSVYGSASVQSSSTTTATVFFRSTVLASTVVSGVFQYSVLE